MSRYIVAALAGLFLFTSSSSPGAAAPADAFDDPPPPGAVARLGSSRLRHGCVFLAWAPDGKAFASAGSDGSVRVWDPATGKEVRRFREQNIYYNSVAYTPDGKRLVAGGTDGAVHLLDLATGREGRTLSAPQPQQQIIALAARPEDGLVVTLGVGGLVRVWDPATGTAAGPAAPPGMVGPGGNWFQRREALSPDGRQYAAWGPDDLLTVRDAEGRERFHSGTGFKGVDGLAFSADGKTLAAASMAASQVAFWDTITGKEIRRLDGVHVSGRALVFSPDGKYLAGAGNDGAVHVWGAASGKDLRQFELPRGMLIGTPAFTGTPLAFSPDGKTLAAGQGLAIHLYDVENNKELYEFVGHNAPIDDLQFDRDGKTVLTCGKDGVAGRWDAATGKLLAWRTRTVGGGQFSAVAAPDGKTVLLAVQGGVVRWDVGGDKPAERQLVAGSQPFINGLTLAADGKTLAGYAGDRSIYLWDVESGKEKGKMKNEQAFNPTLALSPDGSLLAVASPNMPTRLWDVAASQELRQLGAPAGPGVPAPAPFPPAGFRGATHMAFSPDGRTLTTVSGWELVVWEVATGRERMRVVRPVAQMNRVAVSPDGGLLAVGTQTGAVLLLDAADGWQRAEFPGPTGALTALAFSPDGAALASAGGDGTALIWDVKEWAGRRTAVADLAPDKLAASWDALLNGDAGRAYKAVLALAASPKSAGPFLKERLAGARGPDEAKVAQLINDLNADDFDVRENAQKELDKLGDAAMPAVRQALGSNPPAESRRRLQELVERHKDSAAVTEDVRAARALEALERSGAPEAVEALRALAKDAPVAAVKKEAATALERLGRRQAP